MLRLAAWSAAVAGARAQGGNGLGATPPMGWSSWNSLAGNPTDDALRNITDVMVHSGLRDLGYVYVNLDCGWNLPSRSANGSLQADPTRFPNGIQAVADYVHSQGMKFGLYTEHYTQDCCGGPGAFGHNTQDAQTLAAWGVDYLKVDSCAGHDLPPAQQWADFAAIRDALNATGREVYLSICPTIAIPQGLNPPCQAWDVVYSPSGWNASAGYDVRTLANSFLVEFCNNANSFSVVESIIDAQQAITTSDLSGPGHWNDMDMLTVGCNDNPNPGSPCEGSMTYDQQVAQFSMWCILASPLILGSDLRYMSPETFFIIGNKEAIAINQDPLGFRGVLVNESSTSIRGANANVQVAPCDATDPQQAWTLNADGSIVSSNTNTCLDVWNCGTADGTVVDVYACHISEPACGGQQSLNQLWAFDASTGQIQSALGNASTPLCLDVYNWTGPVVDLWQCHGTLNQAWHISGSSIISQQTGQCLKSVQPQTQQIYAKLMSDGSRAVVLLNRGTAPASMTVTWKMIQLGAPVPWNTADVRDVWAQTTTPNVPVGFTAAVNATSAVMLRITRRS